MPKKFNHRVTHITMGKWPGIGLVRTNTKLELYSDRPPLISNVYSSRGVSSQPSCAYANLVWTVVSENIANIDNRRQYIINERNFDADFCWGVGLMIFAPQNRTDGGPALKNHLLPLLQDVAVDKVKYTKKAEYDKDKLCLSLMAQVTAWVNNHPMSPGQGIADRTLCTWVSKTQPSMPVSLLDVVAACRDTWDVENLGLVIPKSTNFHTEIQKSLASAKSALLFEYTMKSSKRKRVWIAQDKYFFKL